MQSLLQSQDAESGGRKNENRYELVSAVKELYNPNWCNQMLITNGRKGSF